MLQWVSRREQEARAEMLRLLEVDPLSGYAHVICGFSSVSSGRVAEAVSYAKRGVELDPKSYLAHWCVAVSLECDGKYEEAAAADEYALSISGRHPWALSTLTAIYSRWGKHDKAVAVYRELEARASREYVQPAMLTPAAAAVGEIDRAIEFAQQAVNDKDPLFIMLVRTWPDYESLRREERFLDIISGLHLPGWTREESAPQ
jgi:tetratricopeptide (TPR) repeat protein